MVTKTQLNQFEKYIRAIILPKFKEIIDFEIKIDDHTRMIEFIFDMDGTEEEVEDNIVDAISDMFVYLSVDRVSFGFKFNVV